MKHEKTEGRTPGSEGHGNGPVAALRVGSNRTGVKLELQSQGRDFLLLVTGGEAHVGAVAVWDVGNETGPIINEMSGHREGPLAGECAEILGRACGRTVVAVVGIHQDNATPEEITAIVANVRQGAAELASFAEAGFGEQKGKR
ncbi:MAG: hypothetical protein ABFS42_15620 [Candidatus Krumholzibacteriota bacterium]